MHKVYRNFSSIIRQIPIATMWSGGYGQRILSTWKVCILLQSLCGACGLNILKDYGTADLISSWASRTQQSLFVAVEWSTILILASKSLSKTPYYSLSVFCERCSSLMARLVTVSILGQELWSKFLANGWGQGSRLRRNKLTKIRIPSVYWENNACAHSVYQALSPLLKGPGDEANMQYA